MPERRDIRAVLFDLDGTFADTAPDLAYALNETLRRFGGAELPYERIRPHVSHGATALIRLGFGLEPGSPAFEERRQVLLRDVRHPLYLASLLVYLALTVSTMSMVSFLLLAGIFVFHNTIASYEESLLEAKFGEEYKTYKDKTGKWLPRIW